MVNLHKKILKDAGLGHIRFHDLCHTFATLALQNGVDIKTVSSMLGHYDAGFTLRTYTHATRQKQDEAAETMGNLGVVGEEYYFFLSLLSVIVSIVHFIRHMKEKRK